MRSVVLLNTLLIHLWICYRIGFHKINFYCMLECISNSRCGQGDLGSLLLLSSGVPICICCLISRRRQLHTVLICRSSSITAGIQQFATYVGSVEDEMDHAASSNNCSRVYSRPSGVSHEIHELELAEY